MTCVHILPNICPFISCFKLFHSQYDSQRMQACTIATWNMMHQLGESEVDFEASNEWTKYVHT